MKCPKANINESHIKKCTGSSSLEIVIHQLLYLSSQPWRIWVCAHMIFYEGHCGMGKQLELVLGI